MKNIMNKQSAHFPNMKHSVCRMSFLLTVLCFSFFLYACQGGKKEEPICPFSEVTWNSTEADITALEGSDSTTYDSVYGGICYTYPKTYENYEGTIKYMFDENGGLMCTAWTYSAEDEETLASLYNQIQTSVQSKYGDTSYETDKETNYGNVWYREEGNIVISTMITSDLKALQYAYLNPAVSTKKE